MPSLISTLATAAALFASAVAPACGAEASSELRAAGATTSVALEHLPGVLPAGLEAMAGDTLVGRTLLKSRRRVPRRKRGTAKGSPARSPKKKSQPKKSSKKKSPPKRKSTKKSQPKKSSKKKSPPKKKSKKKSPSKKKPQFRQQFSSGSIVAETRSSVTVGGFSGSRGSTTSYTVTSRTFTGHGTHFEAMGKPYAGCGVPPHKAYDDNGTPLPWVALNTNSEFENGVNCGRWVKIELGTNCVGAGNSQWSICNGGSWESDGRTGEIMYGYVMDHCPDNNFWCKNDPYHLDLSRPYLTALGLTGPHVWNGRKIHWSYINSAPPGWKMGNLKFMWLKESNWMPRGYGFFGCLIIYNTDDGISRVSQQVGSKWVPAKPLFHLRNQWILQKPVNYVSAPNGGQNQRFVVEVWSARGISYGKYSVDFTCGATRCSGDTDASAYKI